ncbi:hypothetical protein F2Q70_00043199 [Brassica cretica]|uniref:Uncharacterized protein n=1 Tax=Brassica cretica TaxID=69181 RepID=A0A8S9KK39_BRACR|nr:hypothetical protein F2Q70_00043199 [Brassica cretica]
MASTGKPSNCRRPRRAELNLLGLFPTILMELGGISVRFLQSSKTSGGPILWISIDNEVKYDINRAFSNDFDGAWWNLSEVPPEQQDKWWCKIHIG